MTPRLKGIFSSSSPTRVSPPFEYEAREPSRVGIFEAETQVELLLLLWKLGRQRDGDQ